MRHICWVIGGGDLASGVALRLYKVGIRVIISELPEPLSVRRLVSFSEVVYSRQMAIEGISAKLANDPEDAHKLIEKGVLPVVIDPNGELRIATIPTVVIDGRMIKTPPVDLDIHSAPLVIGLGPGFSPGINCHAVIETQRGPCLGRVYWDQPAADDTGIPEKIGEYQTDRVLRSPGDGLFKAHFEIGDQVKKGDLIAEVGMMPIQAPFDGCIRGLLRTGLSVYAGLKVGDLDPRGDPTLSRIVSDKALAVGGGALEAVLTRPEIRENFWT